MNKKVGALDSLGYIIAVVLTLGGAWLIKCVIKKAIADASN